MLRYLKRALKKAYVCSPPNLQLVDKLNISHTPPHLKRVFKFKSEQREFKIEEDSIFPRLKLGFTFMEEEGEREKCPRKEQARMFREKEGRETD